jgi:hypothetical protein
MDSESGVNFTAVTWSGRLDVARNDICASVDGGVQTVSREEWFGHELRHGAAEQALRFQIGFVAVKS